ncbi:hypothetical protein AXF42_Ash009608 [Apostasia shenzhenica]|uniref:Methyltransferase type 11 domain-containing protein n=1 Tax=Apostasia shenzhenica TaxID=1088818 RepID=A0A2I0B9C1_9ASPA|nr:hypothetical protein AXF42_Ash009608 [Apostasia shenzhenica]
MGPARSSVLKILIASITWAAAALLLFDIATTAVRSGGCDSSAAAAPLSGASVFDSAFRELISMSWLAAGDRAVFVGQDAFAAAASAKLLGLPVAVAASASACCALPFEKDSFDFAFSAAMDRARVPARVVLEMERVLRPGCVGAVFRLRPGSARPEWLMRAAAPVSSLLRFSDVIGARAVNGSALVVFRKRGSGGSAAPVSASAGECEERIAVLPPVFGEAIELLWAGLLWGKERTSIVLGSL